MVRLGPKPKLGGDEFGDLLGSQGYSFVSGKNVGPTSINAMRKEVLSKDMDPDKLKVLYEMLSFP